MSQSNIIKNIVGLGRSVLEMSNTGEFKGEVLSRLEAIFQAPTSVFLDWEHVGEGVRNWQEEDLYFPHWDADYRQLYYRQLRYTDPLFNWLDSGRFIQSQSVTRLSNLVKLSDFKKTPLFQVLLQPLKCQYILTIALNCGPDLIANISLLRPSGSRDFSAIDIQAAQLAAPMLSGAYKGLLLKEKVIEKSDLVDIVSNTDCAEATLILSRALEPVYCSKALYEMVCALRNQGVENIEELLSRSDCVSKYLRYFSIGSDSSRRQLPAVLTDTLPIADEVSIDVEIDQIETGRKTSFLRIGLKVKSRQSGEVSVQSKYGLSLREIQIAQLVGEGRTCKEVAENLCISPWTVKNHLKQVYSKVRVNNRAALARLLN